MLNVMCMSILICLLIACAAFAQSEARESRTVRTAQGPIRGYKTDGVFKFFGIPYATAPTGPKRFSAPLPGPVWVQPLEAVNDKIICPQGTLLTTDNHPYIMQENCLFANIHMPDTEEKNLPVLVYVHGGGFNAGWGELLSPHSLVKSKKIVAVTFNYRLGALGFLCLGTEGAPGNAGMKDQVALLRWVNKNIANFGGNPDDVTISGSSAGSSSVDLLMLSKITEGLFNKVIPESGSNVGSRAIQQDPVQNAKDFARLRNVTNVDDIAALEKYFTTAPYDALISGTFFMDRTDSTSFFVPCVERNVVGDETFLEDAPVNILKQGKYRKVPVLYGFTNMEGLSRIGQFNEWKIKMNERFSDFLPGDLQFRTEEEKNDVAQTVKEFYFGNQDVREETVQGYIDYFSDVMFIYPHLRSTQLQVEAGNGPIYLYEYSFYSPPASNNGLPQFAMNIHGANHCAQSAAVYNCVIDNPDKSEVYLKLREMLREIWINFIVTGKPVPEGSKLPAWPPVSAYGSPHMEFGSELKLKGPLLEKRFRFWNNIYERFYRSPVPPTACNKS